MLTLVLFVYVEFDVIVNAKNRNRSLCSKPNDNKDNKDKNNKEIEPGQKERESEGRNKGGGLQSSWGMLGLKSQFAYVVHSPKS